MGGEVACFVMRFVFLWLQFHVFMEALLRRRALCDALVIVLRLRAVTATCPHSGFAAGSAYKIACSFLVLNLVYAGSKGYFDRYGLWKIFAARQFHLSCGRWLWTYCRF